MLNIYIEWTDEIIKRNKEIKNKERGEPKLSQRAKDACMGCMEAEGKEREGRGREREREREGKGEGERERAT